MMAMIPVMSCWRIIVVQLWNLGSNHSHTNIALSNGRCMSLSHILTLLESLWVVFLGYSVRNPNIFIQTHIGWIHDRQNSRIHNTIN